MKKVTLALLGSAALFAVASTPVVAAQDGVHLTQGDPKQDLGEGNEKSVESGRKSGDGGNAPAAGGVESGGSPPDGGVGEPKENLGEKGRESSGGK